jgi:hypothetical protein
MHAENLHFSKKGNWAPIPTSSWESCFSKSSQVATVLDMLWDPKKTVVNNVLLKGFEFILNEKIEVGNYYLFDFEFCTELFHAIGSLSPLSPNLESFLEKLTFILRRTHSLYP